MAKYLRYAEVRGFLRSPTPDESPANRLDYLSGCPNWFTGAAMYFRLALPVACASVQKLNIYGCPVAGTLCSESVLGIADVWSQVPEDAAALTGNCTLQQRLVLDLAHAAVQAASKRFDFSMATFDAAYQQVEANDYALEYQVGKTKTSPDKKWRASVWCRFEQQLITELLVTNFEGTLVSRYPFAQADDHCLGQLTWEGSGTIRVPLTAATGDPHWLCSLDGTYQFVYPKSAAGSPHALYQHATMLLDGIWVIPDRLTGLALLHRSAAAGYSHAIKRLARETANPFQ